MPVFKSAPSGSIANSVRALLSMGGPTQGQYDAVDSAAASYNRNMSLAEKARLEAEQMREQAALRANPGFADQFSSRVAGVDLPTGSRMSQAFRGEVVPNLAPNDDEGNVMPAAPIQMPTNVDPQQTALFNQAQAALLGNRVGTGKTNAAQLMDAVLKGQKGQNIADVMRMALEGDVTGTNLGTAVIHGGERSPFRTNAQGTTVTNQYEGTAEDAGTEIAKLVGKEITARTGRAGAQAGQATATAELRRAQALNEPKRGEFIEAGTKVRKEGRPPVGRTKAQEDADASRARKGDAAAQKAELEITQADFSRRPEHKGQRLGGYVETKSKDGSPVRGYQVIDKTGKVVGIYEVVARKGPARAAPARAAPVDDNEDDDEAD